MVLMAGQLASGKTSRRVQLPRAPRKDIAGRGVGQKSRRRRLAEGGYSSDFPTKRAPVVTHRDLIFDGTGYQVRRVSREDGPLDVVVKILKQTERHSSCRESARVSGRLRKKPVPNARCSSDWNPL